MARTLGDLAKQMRKLAKEFDEEINGITKDVADTILFSVIVKTPVDTSAAKSNWQIMLGNNRPRAIPAYYEGKKGSTKIPSQKMAYQIGYDTIQTRVIGEPIHIVNVLHYIDYLEGGSSQQAPRGMMKFALLDGRAKLNLRMKKIQIKI